jgi:gliding motility-associated-like protein
MRVVPKPLVDFLTEDACFGFTVDLSDLSQPVTGSIVQYQWSFGDGTISNDQNPTHLYSTYGYFNVSLTVTSDSGCISTLLKPNAINIFAPPKAVFISNAANANDIYPLVNFVNQTVTPGFFYWNFGDGDTSTVYSPTHLYPDVGVYDVQLVTIDLRGCVDTTLVPIEIKPTSNIYIPNAFTPNGDTRNDYFKVYSYNVVSMEVQIYDRWGIKIVEWKDPLGFWDGKVNGSPAQSDTYVYRVSTIDVNDMKEVHVGHVSLVR